MLAYGEALAGTGKPLVAAGSIGSPGDLGRPATEEDPALPSGEEHKGTLRARNVVELAVVGLAERGVRSSIVRLPLIAHGTTDSAGFLPGLIGTREGEGLRRLPRRRREPVVRRAHPRCRLRVPLGAGEGSGWQILARDCGRGHPVPRDRRGHRQPSGLTRRERSRGRPDAAGILRAPRESGHEDLPGRPASSRARPWAGNPLSPTCSPIWTTAITSPPADGLGAPTESHPLRGVTMTTFAPHRDTLESFVDCIHGGADKEHPRRFARRGRGAVRPVRR